jgi:hypothetical protein
MGGLQRSVSIRIEGLRRSGSIRIEGLRRSDSICREGLGGGESTKELDNEGLKAFADTSADERAYARSIKIRMATQEWMMKLAILRLERPTALLAEECNLGVEHLVPGRPESIWVAVELGKDEYLDEASKRSYEKYPMEQGWKVVFGTVNGRLLE